VGVVNRAQLRQLAEDRILDAERLLAAGRWGGAYYLAGYAVECGLKACIMAHVEAVGAIFQDKRFSEKCWTHDLEDLLQLANLEATLGADTAANATLFANWAATKDWKETSRYEQKTQAEAQSLYNAIANDPDGMLPWIRKHW
jgi:HEPN domain-containing protein